MFQSLPPPALLPLLAKAKNGYLLWTNFQQAIPKIHKYSLGQKISETFVEMIEAIASASFLSREEKRPWVRLAIRKADVLKVLLMILWEAKGLDNKKYAAISVPLEEIGKMLGGWNGQLVKQNSLAEAREK